MIEPALNARAAIRAIVRVNPGQHDRTSFFTTQFLSSGIVSGTPERTRTREYAEEQDRCLQCRNETTLRR
jgi:hypothetical protein